MCNNLDLDFASLSIFVQKLCKVGIIIDSIGAYQMFIRLLICISFAGFVLYKYIDKANELTEVRLSIPILAREVKEIEEKNLELQYAIDTFESPLHLMELARKPEFGHLKYPTLNEIVQLPEVTLICPEEYMRELQN